MFWNFYFIANILITIIFFLNLKKFNLVFFIIPFGFLFYINFYYGDNLDVLNYYNQDVIYLLPSYISSLQSEYASFLKSPYVNLFSPASTTEIITRNIILYFKINNIEIYILPFLFLSFYIFSLRNFLKSFYLSKKIYLIIFLTILFSKATLYQNFHSFRLSLGLGYILLVLSFYFKNSVNRNQIFKTNILLMFSLLFHTSLVLYVIVFNISVLLKYIRNHKFFLNSIILIFLYASFYLTYKEFISEILFYNIPASSYILSKVSWFSVHNTGTTSHMIYYLINPLVAITIICVVNYLDYNKKKNHLELFTICSLLIIILFINNTFIWKRIIYMFFPFYVLLIYINYKNILLKLKKIKIFSKINFTFLLILNIFLLQMISDFLNFEINNIYFVYMVMTIFILKFENYPLHLKNYNIFLFLPFLNISYLSLISLSGINLYL